MKKKNKGTQNSSRSDQDKEEFMGKVQISHIISHLWNDIECSLNNRYKIIGIKRLIVLLNINPLAPNISLVVLLTDCYIVLEITVWRIWFWIN